MMMIKFMLIVIFTFTGCYNGSEKNYVLNVNENDQTEDKTFTGTKKIKLKDKVIIFEVVKGVKNGKYQMVNKKGIVEISGNIINGKYEGKWKYFYSNGSLESEGYFTNDVPEGYWVFYFKSGSISSNGSFVKGKKIGYWYTFTKEGSVKEEVYFANDNVINDKKT